MLESLLVENAKKIVCWQISVFKFMFAHHYLLHSSWKDLNQQLFKGRRVFSKVISFFASESHKVENAKIVLRLMFLQNYKLQFFSIKGSIDTFLCSREKFVKFIFCMFNQSFLDPFDGQWRSAISPLVFVFSINVMLNTHPWRSSKFIKFLVFFFEMIS